MDMDESVVSVALVSVEKMKIFLYQNTNCPSEVYDVLERAKSCLEIIQAYLRDYSENQTNGSSLRTDKRVSAFIDIAAEIEDVLDAFMYELFRLLLHGSKLPLKIGQSTQSLPLKIVQQACQQVSKHIEITISMLEGKSELTKEDVLSGLPSTTSDRFTKETLKDEKAVGFEKLEKKLIEQLLEEDPSLSTISIYGMGGLGKTTLAKMVYESIRVPEHFDCKAWVDLSHPLGYTDVLNDMLSKFGLNKEEESGEADKRALLRQFLQEKRFLIVLDDVWRLSDWTAIRSALPKSGSQGSRVVLTSRNSHIGSSSAKYVHDLSSGLSDYCAWELFCRKAFPNSQGKPPDLLERVPQKFVKLCEGLPLAISTLGTWLSLTAPNPVAWRNKYDYLGHELCKDDPDLSVLHCNLLLSYRHLPSHLKSCFLYLSMFPEGYSVSRERLVRLWVAEGFVTPERGIPVEQVAEGYLNELIARNLIVVTAREGHGGRVRRCRVSHLVRQINISRQKSFATVLDENYVYRILTPCAGEEKIRRLFLENGPFKLLYNKTTCVRSFLVFEASSRHELQTVFKTSKFLNVLDLNGAALKKFPKSIVRLYLLKYLSLRNTQIKFVPKSIGNLLSLETLDLKNTQVCKLPEAISKLQRLRHLLACQEKGWSAGVVISARTIRALSSIQKLSLIRVATNRRILKVLGELIGLRKLGLTDLKKEKGAELCASIEKMQNLSTLDVESTSKDEYLDLDHMHYPLVAPLYLQHLYLRGPLQRVPQWISELTSLTKIGLKWSKLRAQANPLDAIQALPNLLELDLLDFYTGNELVFKAETFLKLVKLNLTLFDKLTSVVVEPRAMPSLQNLVIGRCQNLKELPTGIEGLTLLKEFFLHDMPDKFIAKLHKYGEDRRLVKHIGVIRSYHGANNGSYHRVIDLSPTFLEVSTSSNSESEEKS